MKQNNSLKELGQQLLAADSVLLFPHVNIDGDALGSCVALCAALRNAGRQAWILTEEEVGEYVGFQSLLGLTKSGNKNLCSSIKSHKASLE